MDTERLQEKALELSVFANTTTRTGNAVVLFAMLVLNEILEMQARQPQSNLANILDISRVIAALSLSLRI